MENYSQIISNLVLLKKDLPKINHKKYQKLIQEIVNYNMQTDSDVVSLPNQFQLAEKLGYSQPRMNALLRDLDNEVWDIFPKETLTIKKLVYTMNVFSSKEDFDSHSINERITSLSLDLPVCPHVGDLIMLPFVNTNKKNSIGTVQKIYQTITGLTQEIHLVVYPEK